MNFSVSNMALSRLIVFNQMQAVGVREKYGRSRESNPDHFSIRAWRNPFHNIDSYFTFANCLHLIPHEQMRPYYRNGKVHWLRPLLV
jgi:hypothetical protein